MKRIAIAVVVSLAILALHGERADAQDDPEVLPAVCMTVEATIPFAPAAQAWMRGQQRAGARSFLVSGSTVCSY